MITSNPNEETRFSLGLGLYGLQESLDSQAQVLGVGKLVDIANADKGGLAGQEGLGDLGNS